jgi:hypothetical protein
MNAKRVIEGAIIFPIRRKRTEKPARLDRRTQHFGSPKPPTRHCSSEGHLAVAQQSAPMTGV